MLNIGRVTSQEAKEWLKERGMGEGCKVSILSADGKNREESIIGGVESDSYVGKCYINNKEGKCIDILYRGVNEGIVAEYDIQLLTSIQYSFQEVMGRIKEGEIYKCTSDEFTVREIKHEGSSIKIVSDDSYVALEARFTLASTPVSFMEALQSGKKIRVEHKHFIGVSDNRFDSERMIDVYREVERGEYIEICDIMGLLSHLFVSPALVDIINEGKWYIES